MIKNENHTKPQQQIIHAMAKLLNELNMDFDAFCKTLRRDYVLIAHQSYKGVSRIAFKTGIDRRTVSAILKNKTLRYKRALLLIIVDAIKDRSRHKNMVLPKTGLNSLASIISDKANGTITTKTVLDVLITTGIIEDQGTKFKFLGYPPLHTPKNNETTVSFSKQFDELVNAFIRKVSDR